MREDLLWPYSKFPRNSRDWRIRVLSHVCFENLRETYLGTLALKALLLLWSFLFLGIMLSNLAMVLFVFTCSFLRRVSTGSCVSVSDSGGGMRKASDDLSKPSPCDVTAFVPVTPCSCSKEAGNIGGVDVTMSPVRREGTVKRRGRFVSDFEVLEEIGTGSFGTVYKVSCLLMGDRGALGLYMQWECRAFCSRCGR